MNKMVQPRLSGNDLNAILSMLERERSGLAFMKNNLSLVFEKAGSFILESSRELESFKKIIRPYLDYFFPVDVKPDDDCFINDVVEPSRLTMGNSIGKAVDIMQGDSEANARVSAAIREALGIRTVVENLLEMIEAIETHSWNAMLISAKAGVRGQTLAKISEEMSVLSSLANRTAEGCTVIIQNLNNRYDEFDAICSKIDIIKENHLTLMSIKSAAVFRDMKNDMTALSGSVNDIMGYTSSLEGAVDGLMGRLQMEDIVRQNIEKVMYLVEEITDGGVLAAALYDCDDPSRMNEFMIALIHGKLNEINENIRPLAEGSRNYQITLKEIMSKLLGHFYRDSAEGKDYYEGTRFDEMCAGLEMTKGEFVGYIEEIISGKKNLYTISRQIVEIMGKLGTMFEAIGKISRRFEVINMLTRIELARHADLKRRIGGSLADMNSLPAVMKKIVEKALDDYRRVTASIEEALGDYLDNFRAEEESLALSIDAMKNVSVKMFESRKYYRDISEKVGSTGMGLLGFIETHEGDFGVMMEITDLMYNVICPLNEYGALGMEEFSGDENLMRHVRSVIARHNSGGDGSDYRAMLLVSLLNEAVNGGVEKDGRLVLF